MYIGDKISVWEFHSKTLFFIFKINRISNVSENEVNFKDDSPSSPAADLVFNNTNSAKALHKNIFN